jgi:hypothetical protein
MWSVAMHQFNMHLCQKAWEKFKSLRRKLHMDMTIPSQSRISGPTSDSRRSSKLFQALDNQGHFSSTTPSTYRDSGNTSTWAEIVSTASLAPRALQNLQTPDWIPAPSWENENQKKLARHSTQHLLRRSSDDPEAMAMAMAMASTASAATNNLAKRATQS